MVKLNNKGISIVEVVVTFSLIMIIVCGLLVIVANYRNKAQVSFQRLTLDTFKDNITRDVYSDILEYGVKEINQEGKCIDGSISGLNRCINIVYNDPLDPTKTIEKAFGTSGFSVNDKVNIENKFIYYDGIKYKLKDVLPENAPQGRTLKELEAIEVNDDGIFNKQFTVLEDGSVVYIYKIDIDINHVDYKEDFGIHIVASTLDVSLVR